MITIHRTTSNPPLAVLQHGQGSLIFPWTNLLSLRRLAGRIPPRAADDEDHPYTESGPWTASGSSFGIALALKGEIAFFEAEEWEQLRGELYHEDNLLHPADVALITGRRLVRVSEAIATGALFAFQIPERKRRQWLIPLRAVQEWDEPLYGPPE